MAAYEPKVNTVTISPNPVNFNSSFTIAVSVSEVEIVMYRVSAISGAVISGQGVVLATSKEVSS